MTIDPVEQRLETAIAAALTGSSPVLTAKIMRRVRRVARRRAITLGIALVLACSACAAASPLFLEVLHAGLAAVREMEVLPLASLAGGVLALWVYLLFDDTA